MTKNLDGPKWIRQTETLHELRTRKGLDASKHKNEQRTGLEDFRQAAFLGTWSARDPGCCYASYVGAGQRQNLSSSWISYALSVLASTVVPESAYPAAGNSVQKVLTADPFTNHGFLERKGEM